MSGDSNVRCMRVRAAGTARRVLVMDYFPKRRHAFAWAMHALFKLQRQSRLLPAGCYGHLAGSPPAPWRRQPREIGIDHAHCGAAHRAGLALGQRGENAIDPIALQIAIDVHADRIAGIVGLRPHGKSDQHRCERTDGENGLEHDNLES